jgi:hypothetical protein
MQNATTPSPDIAPVTPGQRAAVYVDGMPSAVYQGAVAARRELNNQRQTLRDTRRGISEQLRNPMVDGPDRAGLESQIRSIDARIEALDKELVAANARVASTALVPGATVEPRPNRDGPPEEVYVLSGMFIGLVLFPLSIAWGLRIVRRGKAKIAALPQELMERFTRIDQAVDAMAVEVERIGEGQRFVTRLMSESPASAARALEGDRSRT